MNKKNRIMDYDIRELGEQLMPLGMLVTLDSIPSRRRTPSDRDSICFLELDELACYFASLLNSFLLVSHNFTDLYSGL